MIRQLMLLRLHMILFQSYLISINLSSWNVYINPISGKVTKIYIVKNIKENNQSITQQLTWEK